MSGKFALIIANTEYTDSGLSQLKAPGRDAEEFQRVLRSPDIGAFDDVCMFINEDSHKIAEQIEVFYERRKPDDLLLLYFSGHGVRDESGALYLAVRNTNRSRLRSTAIKSDFIRGLMDECRSRRQVLILDCCNSGAFAQGTKAEVGGSIGTATAFKGTGYGRVILTASDSTQFAWEGDRVIGETENSLFTHFLIKGLEGEADRDGIGHITLDDLYDYAYEQIVNITPRQTPGKWAYKQQGEIVLREHIRINDVKPLPLPPELLDELEDSSPYVREAAIQKLTQLASGRNLRLAVSARQVLEGGLNKQENVPHLPESKTKSIGLEPSSAVIRTPEKVAPPLIAHPGTWVKPILTLFTRKDKVSRTVLFSISMTIVIIISAIAVRAFGNPATPTATQMPVVQPTMVIETKTPTSIPPTPTAAPTIVPTQSLAIGSTYNYVDGETLVAVPAGEFSMGGDAVDNQKHKVTVDNYWLYLSEVTNQQYAFCVSLGKCTPPDPDDNPGYSDYKSANNPVTGVTYDQAVQYCGFVHGRLPSEAEWEKAAQGSKGEKFPWGEGVPSCDLLNFNNCLDGTSNVIEYSNGASYYGALNMAGNTFEWTADWYDANYYGSFPVENPTGPTTGTLRSVRSSSYISKAEEVDVTIRNSVDPQEHRPDLGFRCVVEDPAYFAPFCELPSTFANPMTQEDGSLETCPTLNIKAVPFCSNGIPLTNITFIGPEDSKVDSQDCTPSDNPDLFTCKSKGKTVSIAASCQLGDLGTPSCPTGYLLKDAACSVGTEKKPTSKNCLAGEYNSVQQCCNMPSTSAELSNDTQLCPVGWFYAAKAHACLPQPVQGTIAFSTEVPFASSCTNGTGVSGGGGSGGSTGCQASQAEITNCNAQKPYYHWDSTSCSCVPS